MMKISARSARHSSPISNAPQRGERYAADELHNLSRAGKPLLVRYDLDGIREALSKTALAQRPRDLWRYRELLPVRRAERHRQPRRGCHPLLVAMPQARRET